MTKRFAIRNENTIKAAIAKAKAKGVATANVTDGEGLYLECSLTPGKAKPMQWRFQFASPLTGKRNRLSFGEFIMGAAHLGVSIEKAREKAAEARALIRDGVDPAQHRDATRTAAKVAHAQAMAEAVVTAGANSKGVIPGSFRAEAEAWQAFKRPNWSKHYARTVELSLINHIYPLIGDMPVADVRPVHLLPLREKHEQAGTIEALAHALGWASAVFDRAAEYGRYHLNNPVVIPKTLIADKRAARVHRAAVTEADSIRALMQAIYAQPQERTVIHAMLLTALTMQRIGSVTTMRWADIDLEAQVWVVPAANMKLRTTLKRSRKAELGQLDHIVPLSTQAVALLRQIKMQQGAGLLGPAMHKARASEWVLPSYFDVSKHMARTSATDYLRDQMGYADKHCMHGFRAMGRHAGEYQAGADAVHLELQLAHTIKAGETANMRETYRRGDAHFRSPAQVKARSATVQRYADYLDELCGPGPWAQPPLKLAA